MKIMKMGTFNKQIQYYKRIPLRLIQRHDYEEKGARRFAINYTNQNVWIPNQYLDCNGTILPNVNLDFIFFNKQGEHKLKLAGMRKRGHNDWIESEKVIKGILEEINDLCLEYTKKTGIKIKITKG